MKEILLARRKLTSLLIMCLLLLGHAVSAQQRTVTGTVKDGPTGDPLPGVNVIVQGTTNGTITDGNGAFAIDVSSDEGILVFSFIGYEKKEVTLGTQNSVEVSLNADITSLQEVVVVGYGTQKKSVLTGAISSVKASQLETMPITRLEQALQGRVSGVSIASNSGQPGDGATVRVRGITSFNKTDDGANNQPLWVVDGVIVDNGGIGYLNQSDIESIEVLKDAASQAIYGARAAAGVILVTTKKGKSGKFQINYNAFYGTSAPTRKLDLLNATQYASLINEMRVANNEAPTFSNPASLGKGTDWQAQIFNKDARRQNHEFSISGGNDKSTFYTSFGYLSQEGIVATDISKYSRLNVRLNSTHKLSKWITVGQNLGYAHNKSIGIGNTNSEFGGPLSSAINLDPVTPVVVTDPVVAGSSPYAPTTANYNGKGIIKDANGNPYGISPYVGQEMTNPVAFIKKQLGNYSWGDNIVGNAFLEAEPLKALKFRSTLGTKLAFWGDETYTPTFWLNSSSLNATNNFSRSNNVRVDWNLENTLSYTKTFNMHNFTVLAGQGVYVDNNSRMSSVTFSDVPAQNFNQASFNSKVPGRTGDGSEGQLHKVSSLFARLNYSYNEKYLITALIRRDGSSRFGSNYRHGLFPSVSAGWVPTLENFWNQNPIVNFLKIRGSYGVVGSDAIGDFAFVSTIGGGRSYTYGTSGNFTNGASPNAPPNPNLRWEQTVSANIGFEATLLQDFNLTFDWYKKTTNDILQNLRIPGYVGAITNPATNVANMENSGFEIELGWKKNIGDLHLGVNGNMSYLQNKVTYIANGVQFLTDGNATFHGSTYGITRTEVGHTYNSFYGFKRLGVFQTQEEVNAYRNADGNILQPNAKPGDFKWEDVDHNGVINEYDRMFLGNPMPKYTYGITLNAAYKGFDFTVFGQGSAGNKIFQGNRRFGIPTSNFTTEALGRWTGPGTSNNYPRLTIDDPNGNFSLPSDFYLKNGNFFRLKTVQIGYTVPKAIAGKVGFQRVRVYVMSENLATFTKYNGYSPEIGGGTMSIDRGIYPQARSFMMGINVGL